MGGRGGGRRQQANRGWQLQQGSVRTCSTGTFECVHVNYVCVACEREVTGMF